MIYLILTSLNPFLRMKFNINIKSPIKPYLLDPWPTSLVKEFLDIHLPSITKLVNCSLPEGVVRAGFKKVFVSELIKKASLPPDELKNYRLDSGLGSSWPLS